MTLHDATGPDLSGPEEAVVQRLRALSADAVTPAEEFRATTRSRLVAMAAVRTPATSRRPPVSAGLLRRLAGAGSGAPSSRWRTRLTAGLAGAALTVTALGGLLAAAQGARPGDLLYDLKRGGEQTQLALAGDSRRGTTLLDFATTRLDELQQLVGVESTADAVIGSTPSGGEAGLAAGPDVDLVLSTLRTMDRQTTEGTAALTTRAVQQSDGHALQLLTGWAADQQRGLATVAPAAPSGTGDALAAARDLVGQVAARSTALRTALDCAGGPATSGSDALGPVPAGCVPTPAAPSTGASPSSASLSAGAPAPTAGTTAAGPTGSVPASGAAGPGASSAAGPTSGAPGTTKAGGLPSLPTTTRPGAPLPSITITVPTIPPPASIPPLLTLPPVPGVCVSIPLVQVC